METKRQGVFTAEWLTRVALAAPTKSIRSLMRSFSDVAGVDHTIVGRSSIRHIRNAFCETYKSWVADYVASVCRQALLKGRGKAFVSFQCLHLHDGADVRMRSPEDEDPRAFTCRSRSSNVLGQVVTLYTNCERVSIPMELVPLVSKNADTLATALDNTLRYVGACAFPVSAVEPPPGGNGKPASSGVPVPASSGVDVPASCGAAALASSGVVVTASGGVVVPAPSGVAVPASSGVAGPEKWFLHILLGDGIPTNEAAAKTVWKMAVGTPIGPLVRYFLKNPIPNISPNGGLGAKIHEFLIKMNEVLIKL